MLVVFETCSLAVKKAKISHEGEAGICGVENGGVENGGVENVWRNMVSSSTSMGNLGWILDGTGWGVDGLGTVRSRSDCASATHRQTTELLPLSFGFPVGVIEGLNSMVPVVPPPPHFGALMCRLKGSGKAALSRDPGRERVN